MPTEQPKKSQKSSSFHRKNKHKGRYDFPKLIEKHPELEKHVFINPYDSKTIDFFNPKAVKALNTALLKSYYEVSYWDIPDGYLCPPIPGRADYIHHIAELLSSSTSFSAHRTEILCMDIGTGANCVFPIIGSAEYGWSFIATEMDDTALKSAEKIIENNPVLKERVELRKQKNPKHIFKGILSKEDEIDLSICNPPFHSSYEEAQKAAKRKLKNLKKKEIKTPVLNFGGKHTELWCEGGEEGFIKNMIQESKEFAHNCFWFSTLISNEKVLKRSRGYLKAVHPKEVKTISMSTGNKTSRILAWTFLTRKEQKAWVERNWK